MNLTDCLGLGITKILAKIDLLTLIDAFCHCAEVENATRTCYTTMHIDCMAATDSQGEALKNHTCVVRSTAIRGITLAF